MHINTLHKVLKRAGLTRRKLQSAGLVRGYRPVKTDGYVISERKEDNPEWMGIGMRKQLPKFLPTGIFEINPGSYDLETIKMALINADIAFHHTEGQKLIIVDADNQSA